MPPVTFDAFKFNVCPAHIGELLDAVGAEGTGVTVIFTLSDAEQPPDVIVSVSL